jgi:dolichyl-diphosphooligosaccharide--protein glycosyltransferase
MRSEDGRGPLWWAYEMKNKEAIALLKKFGAKESERDRNGKKPKDLA